MKAKGELTGVEMDEDINKGDWLRAVLLH